MRQYKDEVLRLFEATGTDPDEYLDLAGCADITDQNIGSYIGAFEIMIDNMINKNGGKA
jgi:hypothetical protein